MASWQFHLAFVELLARHRTPLLTDFFTAMSAMGSEVFYFLLIVLLYVAWDKRLAVRLSFLVLVTSASNTLLKNLIHNPRPFVSDGSYRERWAVSQAQAAQLAAEYSTPSGHAMGAGCFYSYLYASIPRPWVRIAAVLLILLIGFSRPYLGVHYGEDILLGWVLGLGIALIAVQSTSAMQEFWVRRSFVLQVSLAVAGSLVLFAASAAQNGWRMSGQLQGVVAYAGFFTGVVIGCPLERRWVGFDASRGSVAEKAMRFLIANGLISFVLIAMRQGIEITGASDSVLRLAMIYLGYAAAAIAGIFGAPWVFMRMKLAETEAAESVMRDSQEQAGGSEAGGS
jgi:membrane-associated phospholipid phosphatase